jgi:hypothetical protein
MHMNVRILCLAIGLVVVAACGSSIRVALKGEPQKPLPPNCEFVFMDVDPDKASLQYQQVGILSIDGGTPGDVGPGLKDKIRPYVCKMGGERVVPMTDEHSWQSDTASYLVLKSRSE